MAELPAPAMELPPPVKMQRTSFRFPARLGLDDDGLSDCGQSPLPHEIGSRVLPTQHLAGDTHSDLERVRETRNCTTLSSSVASEREPPMSLVLPLDMGSGDFRLDDSVYADVLRASQSTEPFQTSLAEAAGLSTGGLTGQGAEPRFSHGAQPSSRLAQRDAVVSIAPSRGVLLGVESCASFSIHATGGSTELTANASAAGPEGLRPEQWMPSGSGFCSDTPLTTPRDEALGEQVQQLGLPANTIGVQMGQTSAQGGLVPAAGDPWLWNLRSKDPRKLLTEARKTERSPGEVVAGASVGRDVLPARGTHQCRTSCSVDLAAFGGPSPRKSPPLSTLLPTLANPAHAGHVQGVSFALGEGDYSSQATPVETPASPPALSHKMKWENGSVSLVPGLPGRGGSVDSLSLRRLPKRMRSRHCAADGTVSPGLSLQAQPLATPRVPGGLALNGIPPKQAEVLMGRLLHAADALEKKDTVSMLPLLAGKATVTPSHDSRSWLGVPLYSTVQDHPLQSPTGNLPEPLDHALMLHCSVPPIDWLDACRGFVQDTFQRMVDQLKSCAKPKGQPMERILHYLLQGLSLRSTGRGAMMTAEPLRKKRSVSCLSLLLCLHHDVTSLVLLWPHVTQAAALSGVSICQCTLLAPPLTVRVPQLQHSVGILSWAAGVRFS